MSITAAWLSRHLHLAGTLTTPDPVTSDTPRDGMNHPVPTTTTAPVRFWKHPDTSTETADTAQVGRTVEVAYFDACDTPTRLSTLTYDGDTFEFLGEPQPWRHPRTGELVGYTAKIARTV